MPYLIYAIKAMEIITVQEFYKDIFEGSSIELDKFLGKINGALSGSHSEIAEVTSEYETEIFMPAKGMEAFNSAEDELEENENADSNS